MKVILVKYSSHFDFFLNVDASFEIQEKPVDCNLYAVDIDGKVLWKFKTSSSAQAFIELEPETIDGLSKVFLDIESSKKMKTEDNEKERLDEYGSTSSSYLRDDVDELDITTMDGVTKQYRSTGKKYR